MQNFPTDETKFLFSGPTGDIEVWATPIENAKATALICHPHPLYGGTMHNKVVTTLAKAFHHQNLRTVRFNFRGVGLSAGKHDAGHGETEDALALGKWIKSLFLQQEVWLAGFSFGAFVAAQTAAQLPADQLITVAPQVSRFMAARLPHVLCPWLIIQGEQDDVVSPQAVFDWAESIHPRPTVVRFPEAGHFFHGHLTELRKKLEEELQTFTP